MTKISRDTKAVANVNLAEIREKRVRVSGSAVAAGVNPDADLIERCRQFAEADMAFWYQRALDGEDVLEGAWPGHDAERARIAATKATSPAGWQAKALVLSTWFFDATGAQTEDDETGLVVSLLRDMAAPARAEILNRLSERFGPLSAREQRLAAKPDAARERLLAESLAALKAVCAKPRSRQRAKR